MILPRILFYHFNASHDESFRVLADYLLILIDHKFITLDTLNENLVILLRYEWSADKYEQLSTLIRTLSVQRRSAGNLTKDELLLDVLSELTANIDDFEDEI